MREKCGGAVLSAFLLLLSAPAGLCRYSQPNYWKVFHEWVAAVGRAAIRENQSPGASQLAQQIYDGLLAYVDPETGLPSWRLGVQYSILIWNAEVPPESSLRVKPGSGQISTGHQHIPVPVHGGMVPSTSCELEGVFPGSLPPGAAKYAWGWPCFRGGAVAIHWAIDGGSSRPKNSMVFYFPHQASELLDRLSYQFLRKRKQLYESAISSCVISAAQQGFVDLSTAAICVGETFTGARLVRHRHFATLRGVAVFLDTAQGPDPEYGLSTPWGNVILDCSNILGTTPPARICHASMFSVIERGHSRKKEADSPRSHKRKMPP